MKRRILAITGGPSGGKTTLIEALKKEMGHRVTIVPEAASILYRGGFPRRRDSQGLIHIQKAIYYAQRELELLLENESTASLMVCDRGSLDGIAYWPLDPEHFFESIQSNRANELKRYDIVLHLDTAGPQFYDSTNPIRTETYQEAYELNLKIRNAWAGHPQRIVIKSDSDFISKMTLGLTIVESLLQGISYNELLQKYPQLQKADI